MLFLVIGMTASAAMAAVIGDWRQANAANALPRSQPALPISKPVERANAPVAQGVRAVRDADGLFTITASVNGRPLRFVVDTGASVMVLSRADAAAAGVAPNADFTAMATANGSTLMRTAVVARLQFAGLSLRNVPATVADSGAVSLIGENVLGQLQSVSIRGDRMDLR